MNIVITGASKGIGKAIAEKFAANGYSLFLCARNEKELAEAAAGIAQNFPSIEVHYKTCDVSKKQQLKQFADWIHSKASAADVLVNNAGSFIPGHVHEEEDGVIEFFDGNKSLQRILSFEVSLISHDGSQEWAYI